MEGVLPLDKPIPAEVLSGNIPKPSKTFNKASVVLTKCVDLYYNYYFRINIVKINFGFTVVL